MVWSFVCCAVPWCCTVVLQEAKGAEESEAEAEADDATPAVAELAVPDVKTVDIGAVSAELGHDGGWNWTLGPSAVPETTVLADDKTACLRAAFAAAIWQVRAQASRPCLVCPSCVDLLGWGLAVNVVLGFYRRCRVGASLRSRACGMPVCV